MSFEAACPSCSAKLRIPPEHIGKPVRCGQCQTVFQAAADAPPPVTSNEATEELTEEQLSKREANRARRMLDQFVSLNTTGTVTMVLIGLTLLLTLCAIPAASFELWVLQRQADKVNVPAAEVEARDFVVGGVGCLQGLLTLTGGIVFFVWFYRAHKNLPLLGMQGLEYSPGWAIGGFFVPILNLFRPYQIMREVWRASQPPYLAPRSWQVAPVSAMLISWWLMWLFSGVFGQISFRITFSAKENDFQLLIIASVMQIISDVLALPAGLLIIAIIRQITLWQEAKYHRLARGETHDPSLDHEDKTEESGYP